MARAQTSTLDGVIVGYGTRDSYNPEQAVIHTKGRVKEVSVDIDFRNITSFATGTAASKKNLEIPLGSQVLSSQLLIKTGFNTLTSVVIGLKIAAGTTVVANGLHASMLLAALNTAGMTEEGAGAIVGGTALAAASYVSLDVTGSVPTVGHGVLTVRYYEPVASQDPPAVITGVI